MDTHKDQTPPKSASLSLDDHIIKYDMGKMLENARTEFDSALASRELIDQNSIAKFFKLEPHSNDERN
ncbi:MAG: hypothetical protein ACI92G_003195 [Candidatus Pelagisphaera sp.]|jgi:hypothetical protein